MILEIRNLHASVEGREILAGVSLSVGPGEIHAVMGPNGSGKSTLVQVLAGNPAYEVTAGEILFKGKNLLDLAPEERAREGLFVAFQSPVEIPGVNNLSFIRTALDAVRQHRGLAKLEMPDFLQMADREMQLMGVDPELRSRSVNEGFSGGEKKKNEILQLSLLDPDLAVLDETDSGLDIDALKAVAAGVNRFKTPKKGILVVTHYQRLLDYVVPDRVHVLVGGAIVRSGGEELARELEKRGYEAVKGAARPAGAPGGGR